MKDFLVFTSAGENSVARLWAKNPNRSYDIWITNYSGKPGLLQEYADFYSERKGAKFPNFKHLLDNHYDQIAAYKAVMIADDDIVISCERLDNLFKLMVEHDAALVVPAFSRFGKISHDTTARELFSDYRITNFAEVTCPIIETSLLLDFMKVYDPSALSCMGVDWWYLNHWGEKLKNKIIISDTNYCINVRDRAKAGGKREVDKISTDEQRRQRWAAVKARLNINSFPKEIVYKKPKNIITLLKHTPSYVAEVSFSFAVDRALPTLMRPLKRLVKRICA